MGGECLILWFLLNTTATNRSCVCTGGRCSSSGHSCINNSKHNPGHTVCPFRRKPTEWKVLSPHHAQQVTGVSVTHRPNAFGKFLPSALDQAHGGNKESHLHLSSSGGRIQWAPFTWIQTCADSSYVLVMYSIEENKG